MDADKNFAKWASLFVDSMNNCKAVDDHSGHQVSAEGIKYTGINEAGCDLLRSVDAGGIPAFVSSNLIEIAYDNGIDVSDDWTPNEIVDAIRAKAQIHSTGSSDYTEPAEV